MDPLRNIIKKSEIGGGLEALSARIDEVIKTQEQTDEKINALIAIFDHSLRSSMRTAKAGVALRKWTYLANMPNTIFNPLSLPELQDGKFIRWVSGANMMRGQIDDFPRNIQYDLTIEIAKFPNMLAMESFYVLANGVQLPWQEVDGNVFKTIVVNSPQDILALEFGVSPVAYNEGAGCAFAFSKIEIEAR